MKKAVRALKDRTPVDTGRARDGWEVRGNSIVNDVPYASYLNNGSSKQAPKHFVETTLLQFEELKPNGVTYVRTVD